MLGDFLPVIKTLISNRYFENQPNEICSHLSEKVSKGTSLKPEKLQNHCNEGKGKEKKKEREERKEKKRKKTNGCNLSFYNSYFGEGKKKGCIVEEF